MKVFLSFVLLLFYAVHSIGGRKKCGVLADKCMLLSTGNVYWPTTWKKNCNSTPICQNGYILQKKIIEQGSQKVRACCCLLKRIEQCSFCDMSLEKQQTLPQWIEMHQRKTGPQDGSCPETHVKRIFFGGPLQLDKCCCEPKDSPYLEFF